MVNPAERMTCDKIMAHPWIVAKGIPSVELPETFNEKLKEFNARRKLKRAGYMIIALNRFKNVLSMTKK